MILGDLKDLGNSNGRNNSKNIYYAYSRRRFSCSVGILYAGYIFDFYPID